jgi:hypothetical protein
MGLRFLKAALVALLALVAGYAAALGVGLVAFDVFEVSQREGANAMALAFVICPFVAVLSAVVADNLVLDRFRSARRDNGNPHSRGGTRAAMLRVLPPSPCPSSSDGSPGRSAAMGCWRVVLTRHSSSRSPCPWRLGSGAIVLGGLTWWLTRRRKASTS